MFPEKRAALTRRANKLIEWLERKENSTYKNEESVTRLVKLIDLIIWALQRSIYYEDWRPFEVQFKEARLIITDVFESEKQEIANYYGAIQMVIATLRGYSAFIQ